MIRWLFDLLYGAVPADFDSAFGIEESVKRLSAATKRSVFAGLTQQVAAGRESKDRVSLQRVIPFVGNSFKPFFIGQFSEINGGVVLKGRFTLHWGTKLFQSLWFGMCLLSGQGVRF